MLDNFQLYVNEYLKQSDSKDVISFGDDKWLSIKKLKSLVCLSFYHACIDAVVNHIAKNSILNDPNNNNKNIRSWFFQGEECEILRAGSSGWQKGKLKINVTLEFIPDESEDPSPLDDVRQELNKSDS